MKNSELARHIQYTLFGPAVTREDVIRHCEQCVQYDLQAAMLPSAWAPLAQSIVDGTSTHVASAISFPLGHDSTDAKRALVATLLSRGITDIDFASNSGFLLSRMYDEFQKDIASVVEEAKGATTKVIIEFGLLPEEETRRTALRLAEEAGVTFVKQSSGAGVGIPASANDIRFMKAVLTGSTRIKASGKIDSRSKAEALIEAGAELLGTSAAIAILDERLASREEANY